MISSVFAAKSENAIRMNDPKEKKHEYRDVFTRDRDRILYSKEFRRLSGKTQVFLVGHDDHMRTRLTHTLEVAQIATTIAKELEMNIMLSEAISYAHDIGHTPFGHVGERTLNYIMNGCYKLKKINPEVPREFAGFKHNFQSVRVLSELEKNNKNYTGLNCTNYTLWGVLHHSSTNEKYCKSDFRNQCEILRNSEKCLHEDRKPSYGFYKTSETFKTLEKDFEAWTIEALVVSIADEIAQRHHDFEDAMVAKIMKKDELINKFRELFKPYLSKAELDKLDEISEEVEKPYYLSSLSSLIVNFFTSKIIISSKRNLKLLKNKYKIIESKDFEDKKSMIFKNLEKGIEVDEDGHTKKLNIKNLINYEDNLIEKEEEFQKFLKNRILNSFLPQSMDGKASYMIRKLFLAYISNPNQLPDATIMTLYKNLHSFNNSSDDWLRFKSTCGNDYREIIGLLRNRLQEDHIKKTFDNYDFILLRTITDYIAGMTDSFAYKQYHLLYES